MSGKGRDKKANAIVICNEKIHHKAMGHFLINEIRVV